MLLTNELQGKKQKIEYTKNIIGFKIEPFMKENSEEMVDVDVGGDITPQKIKKGHFKN